MPKEPRRRKLKIAFLHPDLGLGGAERLVVDCAVGLVEQGHDVHMFTSRYEEKRSFYETRDNAYFPVTVYDGYLPRHISNRLHILFAILRATWLAVCVCLWHDRYDVIVCDQVSAYLPVLRVLAPNSRLLFYCHFPDQLLAPHASLLQKVYRLPFDWFEDIATAMADKVVANSKFTAGVIERTFVQTSALHSPVGVVYPCVPVKDRVDQAAVAQARRRGSKAKGQSSSAGKQRKGSKKYGASAGRDQYVFLSINRFERKKALHIAVQAMCYLYERMSSSSKPAVGGAQEGLAASPSGGASQEGGTDIPSEVEMVEAEAAWKRVKLVVAGGYDEAVAENVEYHEELKQMALDAGLTVADVKAPFTTDAQVEFLRSFSDEQKIQLLDSALAVLYTPPNEHFGIVPLEAMEAGCPVLADRSGGPCETVRHGVTGYLIPSGGAVVAGAYAAGLAQSAGEDVGSEIYQQEKEQEPSTTGEGGQSKGKEKGGRRRARSRGAESGLAAGQRDGIGSSSGPGGKAELLTGPAGYAARMEALVSSPGLAKQLGAAGRQRVVDEFSRTALGQRLDRLSTDLVIDGSQPATGVARFGTRRWWSGLGCFVLCLAAAVSVVMPALLGAFAFGIIDVEELRSKAGATSGREL